MLSRRSFLQSTVGALGMAGAAPGMALGAGASDYKALVMVYLNGGLDCHDVLIGHDQPSYNQWASSRQSIIAHIDDLERRGSRSRDNLLPLHPINSADFGGRSFAMPPELAPLHSLFEDGKLAIVPNVGPLMEPTDRAMVEARTAWLPQRLGSHNDQASTWQAFAGEGATEGWGGGILDRIGGGHPYGAITASRSSTFLHGRTSPQVQIPEDREFRKVWYQDDETLFGSEDITAAVQGFFNDAASAQNNVMMQDVWEAQERAIISMQRLSGVLTEQTLGNTIRMEENKLANRLATVADLIAGRNALGANRQIFYANLGGFDSHNDHAIRMPTKLEEVAEALARFQAAMDAEGLSENVTVFTASDFGRTLLSNSTGTDHGWGGHHFVMGGAVRGGRIVGEVPTFELNNPQHGFRGALIPQLSVEQYAAELGRWFGLSEGELDEVFTNRGRFDRTSLGLFA